MVDLKRIMAATDLSSDGDLAVEQANERASEPGARLGICLVTPSHVPTLALMPHDHEIAEQLTQLRRVVEQRASDRIQALTARDASDFELFVEDGHAHSSIVECAESWGAGLLVVGSRGSHGTHAPLGSVAERVVRHAHCTVLVCRRGRRGRHVVVGTDFSDPSLPGLVAAAEEARRSGAGVTAVHSLETDLARYQLPGPFGGFPMTSAPPGDPSELADKRLAEALASCGIDGDRRVTTGPAAAELVRLADSLDAQLLVVGTRGRTGLRRLLLGSVAETVVRLAHCSVLVVRLHPA